MNNNNLEFSELKITTSKLQKLDDHQQGIENTNQKLLKEFSNNEAKCITYQKSVEELNDQLSRNVTIDSNLKKPVDDQASYKIESNKIRVRKLRNHFSISFKFELLSYRLLPKYRISSYIKME